MPNPTIATSYGNTEQTNMRKYYPQLMEWVQRQENGPSSWGVAQEGIHPPNMYDAGIGQGSEEEDMILKLIYAALGTKGQQGQYEHDREKRGRKQASATDEASLITDLPAH